MASIYTQNHYGTAPRRVSSGQWVTRTGRQLNAAGSAYWERKFRGGFTDGRGHMLTPSLVQKRAPAKSSQPKLTQASPVVKKPSFDTYVKMKHGDAEATRQVELYHRSHQARQQAKADVRAMTDQHLFGQALPAVSGASKTISPLGQGIIEALSPVQAGIDAAKAAQHHDWMKAGLAASAIVPLGPGRGFKIIKAGEEAAKVLTPEERVLGEMGAARSAHSAKKPIHTYERGKRAATLGPAYEQAGGGEAGYFAKLKALKGEFPNPHFGNLTEMTDAEMRHLFDVVEHHPDLGEYEKLDVQRALRKAREGKGPTPYEIRMIEKAFGEQAAKEFSAGKYVPHTAPAGGGAFGDPAERIAAEMAAKRSREEAQKLAEQNAALDQHAREIQLRSIVEPNPEPVDPPRWQQLYAENIAAKDRAAYRASLKKMGKAERVSNVVNTFRSLMATGDFSYRFRNGLFALAMHPKMAAKTTAQAFPKTFSQKQFDDMVGIMLQDSDIQDGIEKGGLAIHGLEIRVKGREEPFASPLAERGKYNPVRASSRNFTANAVLDRVGIYKSVLDEARANGEPVDDRLIKSAARLANWATGRSDWGHPTAEMLTNTFFFSPKLFKSRLEPFNPWFWKDLHPIARKRAATALVRLVAAGVGVLALAAKYGANVEIDPRSSDFGKIRVGSTRFDIWGGNQQIARTVAQLGTQSTKSTTTGELKHLKPGERFLPAQRLFEGKLSPPISILNDIRKGQMFAGQKLTPQGEAIEHLSPLVWQDIYQAWREQSPQMAGITGVLSGIGVGAQTYIPPKPKATLPKKKGRTGSSIYGGSGRTGSSIYGRSSGGSHSIYRR